MLNGSPDAAHRGAQTAEVTQRGQQAGGRITPLEWCLSAVQILRATSPAALGGIFLN